MPNWDGRARFKEDRMEQPQMMEPTEQGIDLREYMDLLRPAWWKILLLSLAVGIATFAWMLKKPNYYRATATIAPALNEARQNPALGALTTFGVFVGGPSRTEDLETLFKSNDLAVRIFGKYDLWPILYPRKEWKDKPPGEWDAIRTTQGRLNISVNRKSGTLSIAFVSPSAEGSAQIVGYFLEEGKNRLQEEALSRAGKNKKFIEEQIGRTIDALTRERLYGLYGQEVEKEMMARNRDAFGFRVIDSPRVPDRKAGPARVKSAATATALSFPLWCVIFIVWGKKRAKGGDS